MSDRYELVICADTNDADYITETSTVTAEMIERIKPIAEAIKEWTKANPNGYNWENCEYSVESIHELFYPDLDLDDLEFFSNYLPSFEHGIHTIESIVYYELPEKIKLL